MGVRLSKVTGDVRRRGRACRSGSGGRTLAGRGHPWRRPSRTPSIAPAVRAPVREAATIRSTSTGTFAHDRSRLRTEGPRPPDRGGAGVRRAARRDAELHRLAEHPLGRLGQGPRRTRSTRSRRRAQRETLDGIRYLEDATQKVDGTVLRLRRLLRATRTQRHGPGDPEAAVPARRRGHRRTRRSSTVDDAASATVAGAGERRLGGVFNVVDDEPAPASRVAALPGRVRRRRSRRCSSRSGSRGSQVVRWPVSMVRPRTRGSSNARCQARARLGAALRRPGATGSKDGLRAARDQRRRVQRQFEDLLAAAVLDRLPASSGA